MTITRADALEVMATVTACHRRTGPRLDDRDVARATADTWAELFNTYNLTLPQLLAAVKKRATTNADAPEPAEIIAVARDTRRARDAETGPTPAYEALCESKGKDAAELAAARRARELSPAKERPKLRDLVTAIAHGRSVSDA